MMDIEITDAYTDKDLPDDIQPQWGQGFDCSIEDDADENENDGASDDNSASDIDNEDDDECGDDECGHDKSGHGVGGDDRDEKNSSDPNTIEMNLEVAMEDVHSISQSELDPEMKDYINNIKHQIILLGPCKIPKTFSGKIKPVHTTIVEKGELTEKQRRLFRFVNSVLQLPACVRRTDSWWSGSTIRNNSYPIRDYVAFMADSKINNEDVDENNFCVDGIYIVRCMTKIVESNKDSEGRAKSGFIRKLESFRAALKGLQHLIALYRSAQIENEEERERVFRNLKEVRNTHLVEIFIAERRKQSSQLQRENFDNKDRDNMFFDRYSTEQLIEMSKNMWKKTSPNNKDNEILEAVNANVELLLGHHLLFRGDNKRKLELSDVIYKQQQTSRGKIPILGFQLTQSKTMGPDGKPRCMGTCRSKDVNMCLVSAFLFSLFYRFDFKEGPQYMAQDVDFLDKKSWYPIKVLFADSVSSKMNQPICPNHERKLMRICLESIGFISTKLTHLGRKSNAQDADAHRVAEEQIRRAGHWATNALIRFYLTPFPFDFIHFSAGYDPDEPYFVARNIDPPEHLKKMIFPWLEDWKEKVANRPDQSHLDSREKDGVIPKFLAMLEQFRPIILQDLAAKMEVSEDSVFCQHEVTRHPDFVEFRAKIKKSQERKSFFSDMPNFFQVVSEISRPMGSALKVIKNGIDSGYKCMIQEISQLKSTIQSLNSMLIERESRFGEQSAKFEDYESRQQFMEDKIERLCTTQDDLTGLMKTELRLIKDHIARIDSSLSGTCSSTMNMFMSSNMPTSQNVRHNTQPMGSQPTESQPTESQPTESQPTESQPDMVEFSRSGSTSQAGLVPQANVHPANTNLINETIKALAGSPQVNERDPRFSLLKNDHIFEEIDEWFKPTSIKMSIHQRNFHYKRGERPILPMEGKLSSSNSYSTGCLV